MVRHEKVQAIRGSWVIIVARSFIVVPSRSGDAHEDDGPCRCGSAVRRARLGRRAGVRAEEAADARGAQGRDRLPQGGKARLARDRLEELPARRARGVAYEGEA